MKSIICFTCFNLHVVAVLLIAILTCGESNAQELSSNRKLEGNQTTISRYLYGQFAEHLGRGIYDGFYDKHSISRNIVAALKQIHVPNLRWPGGCFADQYHWRDGIGITTQRPERVNTTWGMVGEDNSFGTGEFLELCRQIGCEPYIAGNVGTGSPQEMSDWLEYLNFGGSSALSRLRAANGHKAPYKVALWGVGNESWGCGGNMSPEYYADLYKHYAAFCQDYPGAPLKKIISGANAEDYHWTEVMMKKIGPDNAWGLSLHYYVFPTGKWEPRGSATAFSEQEYFNTAKQALHLQQVIEKHEAIMDKYDPEKKLALLVDEWGVWTDVEPGTPKYAMYQQNSLRDALAAAAMLNIFNTHADRVRGANLAQAVNVIHSLILTKGDKMLLTPTYWVFAMYKVHQDARLLPLSFTTPEYHLGNDSIPAVNASASVDRNGVKHVSLVNFDPHRTSDITLNLPGASPGKVSGQVLTSAAYTDINTFEKPKKIGLKPFTGFRAGSEKLTIALPPLSVVIITVNP